MGHLKYYTFADLIINPLFGVKSSGLYIVGVVIM
jgi:hypothetical protein